MGHLYVLCGPPGAGKTTLLKRLKDARPQLKQVRRITTREHRAHEGDTRSMSLEYHFLQQSVFSGKLADSEVINLIEWNGNYYATRKAAIEEVLRSNAAKVLLEDIPSAVHLKALFGTKVTTILLFVADKESLLDIEFAEPWGAGHPVFDDWVDRIRNKYSISIGGAPVDPEEEGWLRYLERKTQRAIPDLAFIAGRIRAGEDINVLPNRTDRQEETFREFEKLLRKPIARAFISHSSKDAQHASALKDALEEAGIPSFHDETDLGWGSKIIDEIKNELRQCSHLIVVLSPAALESQWVHFEIGQATALGKGILPFLTSPDLRVPDYLRLYKPVTSVESVVTYFRDHASLTGR